MNTDKLVLKETVIELNQYGEGWPFCEARLTDVIYWLMQKLQNIPDEYRSDTVIDITSEEDYGSVRAMLAISYHRPETDDEYSIRMIKKNQAETRRREQDIANAKAVLARYGQST